MANNINCTCGHSWSKASSSKKDMYVCHICGKDNTMKDGGWLDNYGKKPNPNDVQVSTGPGYVGLGYDVQGRDYSPAWGGQFEYGGNVAQKGKSIPAPTSADSLALYNNSMDLLKYYGNQKKYAPMGHENVLPGLSEYITSSNMEAMRQLASRVNRKSYPTTSRSSSIVNPDDEDFTMQDYYGRFVNEPYKYKQREQNNYILDLDSPFTLYDTRITPTKKYAFENIKKGNVWRANPLYGDRVTFYGYDPLSVKPYSMRTPQEKLEWEKKYGKNTPTPPPPSIPVITKETAKPKSTPTKKSKTEPVKQSSKKEPIITNDPKDPRLKAYQDSLNLYNKNKKIYESGILTKSKGLKYENVTNVTKGGLYGEKWYLEEGTPFYVVKKPVQPIEYKKAEEIKPTQPTPRGSKKYIVNGIEVSEEDFLGSGPATGGSKRIIYSTPKIKDRKVLRLDGTPETDPEKIRKAMRAQEKDDEFQSGGFLQPISYKLPSRYRIPYAEPSSELAMSIGGEGGEPAYLIPSFKGGKELKDPIAEYKKTGEHLGGPFKTWQEADKWEQEIRHPYVEKGKPIPTPLKRWGDMAMGGSLPGAVGFTYARVAGSAPSNGKYAKKTKASAQNGKEMKFYQEGLDFKPNSIAQDGKAVKDETMVKKPIITSSIVDSKKQALQKYAREMAQKEQPTLSNFDPLLNASAREQLYKETEQNKLSNQLLKGADVATDLMQLGNFIPNPVGQLVGNIGNVTGGWLDAYQAYDAYNKGDYGDAAINLASVAIPMQLGSSTFRRNSKYLQPGQPLHFLKGNKRVNYIEPFTNVKGMTNKSLMANRALLGTLGAETAYDSYQDGGAIIDPMGQWAHPGEVTIIPSTDITMEGVDYPVLGISDTGDQQMMYPGEDYQFDGEYVTEYPMMKEGGWLNKYQGGGGLTPEFQALISKSDKLKSPEDKKKFEKVTSAAKNKRETVKQDNRTTREKELAQQQLLDLKMAEARGSSPFTQTLSSFTPTGSNEAAGQIAAENIGQMTPMMGATRLFTTAMDPKNNPYGIGKDNGLLANTLGTLGLLGDYFDVGAVVSPAIGSAVRQFGKKPAPKVNELDNSGKFATEIVDPETGESKFMFELDDNPEANNYQPAKGSDFTGFKVKLYDKVEDISNAILDAFTNTSNYNKPLTSLESYKNWAKLIHPELQYVDPKIIKQIHKEGIKTLKKTGSLPKGEDASRQLGLYIRDRLADQIPSFADPVVTHPTSGKFMTYGPNQLHPNVLSKDELSTFEQIYKGEEQSAMRPSLRDLSTVPVKDWGYDINKLDAQELNLIDAYSHGYDQIMNARGSSNKNIFNTSKFYQDKVEQLNQAIQKNKFPEATFVRRGANNYQVELLDPITYQPTGKLVSKNELNVGDVFKDEEFLSTSVYQDHTMGMPTASELVEIPGGGVQSYAYPNAASSSKFPNELEAILPKGLIRRVEEVRAPLSVDEFSNVNYPNNAKYRTKILNPYNLLLPLGGAALFGKEKKENGGWLTKYK